MKSDEFRKLVWDALEHLYDTAYLEVHPLLSQISGVTTANRSTRAQELRSILKDALEELRPPEGLSSGSPEWRSYLVLRCRYVQGMTIGQVENELGLGRRQIQRETLKGLDALASILWLKHRTNKDSFPAAESDLLTPPSEQVDAVDSLEMELNQWQLTLQNCDVRLLVNDTFWLIQSSGEYNQPKIQMALPDRLPPVFVDATLTRQALFRIMRLMVQKSKKIISLTAIPNDRFIVLQMVGQNCILNVDERDWQAAQRIIRDQGGSLDLENNPVLGCQISIRLPVAGQMQVLIVDDNEAMLQLFERYLAPSQYQVKKAHSGFEALSMAAEQPPDLIILDVMMPTMDGWQVLRSLKQNPDTQNTPIIVCSVLKEPELAISLGARAFLKKPVDRLELLAALERILHP